MYVFPLLLVLMINIAVLLNVAELSSFHGELASTLHRRLLEAWEGAKAAVEKVGVAR